jgi:Arc/MetJ-type ribon-helix-helix transcriptional regulator
MTIGKSQKRARQGVPTEQVTIELPVRTIRRGLTVIETGEYPSLADLTNDAILRLLASKEHPDARYSKRNKTAQVGIESPALPYERVVPKGRFPQARQLEDIKIRASQPVDVMLMATPLIPFTVQRLWPGKLCLREIMVVLGESGTEMAPYQELSHKVGAQSLAWSDIAMHLDKDSKRPRGERLASNLPRRGRNVTASVQRFLFSTIGQIYRDGRETGTLPFLGFSCLVLDKSATMVGVTEDGIRFARMENPVADGDENVFPPFSEQERGLLLAHLLVRCPAEAAHVAFYLSVLREIPTIGRADAVRRMKPFYERYWNPLSLTGAMVDTLRGGINSRCLELGLVRTNRSGNEASYTATEIGLRWLEQCETKTRSG